LGLASRAALGKFTVINVLVLNKIGLGLGRGRQNERDLVMVEDPLIDFEEVVVGMRSLGSNPMARGDISRWFFRFTVP
jgi:hypothetical protein